MLSGLIYSLVHVRILQLIPVKELADLELILGSIFFSALRRLAFAV